MSMQNELNTITSTMNDLSRRAVSYTHLDVYKRQQLTSPVEFFEATLALPESVTTTIEMPPSGVLTGLTKRIRPFERQFAPATLADLEGIEL